MVALALVAGAGCSSSDDPRSSTAGRPAQRPSAAAEETELQLTYLRGRQLMRLDLTTGDEKRLGRVPGPDVHPIPGRPDRFLLVRDRGGGEDFADEPVLSVIDERGRELKVIGPGFAPLVDPTGARVAYLRSSGGRVCEGEVCLGSASLDVADLGGDSDRILPPGDWHPLAWAGDDLIVSAAGVTHRVSLSGRSEELDVLPGEVWGATPDGSEMLVSRKDGAEFVHLETGEVRRLRVPGLLGEGEWSPSGHELIAVAVQGPRTSLVRISPGAATATHVPDSDAAVGSILWGVDGSFAYVRADGLDLEAVFCDSSQRCRPILRWTEGVVPLSLG